MKTERLTEFISDVRGVTEFKAFMHVDNNIKF